MSAGEVFFGEMAGLDEMPGVRPDVIARSDAVLIACMPAAGIPPRLFER